MKAVIRGAAVAAALALALTGCTNTSSEGAAKAAPGAGSASASQAPATGGGGSSAPGDGQGVTPNPPPVWLDVTGLYSALPSDGSIGDVMVGGEPFVVQGPQVTKACAQKTRTPCAGVQAVGGRDMETRGSSDDTRVEFVLFTFATAPEASAMAKNLAERQRVQYAEDGTPATPLTVNAGADETAAIREGDSADVVLRVGVVVAHLQASDANPDDVAHAATVQVARVKAVSNGVNPDR
ncbi:hypothetical protein ACFYZ9_28920 [Streptomyces sp. NPDC001691]|uniref:hypothetical protein n=1 Tax=Streptomyces sp. NPDC001691 TaxID=3364600 RepID=UPI00369F0303